MSEVKKVVLAYSGGLDTSIIIPWLKEHYNKLKTRQHNIRHMVCCSQMSKGACV